MTERWRAEAEQAVLEVHEAMRWHDDVGAVDAILELIERAQPQWQPIETAPKNQPVLLYVLGEHRIGVFKSGGGWNQWQLIPGKYPIPMGYAPTHWMPLPIPPGAGAASPSGERQDTDS